MSKYYKHPQYGMVFGVDTTTPTGRLVWPSLVTPKKNTFKVAEGRTPTPPRYEVTLLLDKESPSVKAFLEEIDTVKEEMLAEFNEKRGAKLSGLETFSDGDAFDAEKYPYYRGCWVITARNVKNDFKLFNEKKETVEASAIKGGLLGKLIVQPLITAHGLSYKLIAAKIVKDDGVRFGGSARTDTYLADKFDDGDEDTTPVIAEEMIPVTPEVVNAPLAVPTPMPAPQAVAMDPNALKAKTAASKGKLAAFNKL